jgi:pseudaminic acid biosynthesis-associated methylase
MREDSYQPTTYQTKIWCGEFGDDYLKRNDYSDDKMVQGIEAFRRILGGLRIESVLEVGCNIGLNLHFINALFTDSVKLYAVEPNRKAFDGLVSQMRINLERAWNCDVFKLPLDSSSIDLVFTAGVLIHIAPDDLGRATDEIIRVARKYVLCIEYFSHVPVEVPYRSQMGLLFKRDFGAFYMDRFPDLKCKRYGFLWTREFPIFDNINWWLFEK